MKSIEVGRNPLTSQLVPRVRNRDGVTIQTNNKAKSRFLFTSEDVGARSQRLVQWCEKSLIPRKLVSTVRLFHTEQRIFAANGYEIRALGTLSLAFAIDKVSVSVTFIVGDEIEEMMLALIS